MTKARNPARQTHALAQSIRLDATRNGHARNWSAWCRSAVSSPTWSPTQLCTWSPGESVAVAEELRVTRDDVDWARSVKGKWHVPPPSHRQDLVARDSTWFSSAQHNPSAIGMGAQPARSEGSSACRRQSRADEAAVVRGLWESRRSMRNPPSAAS